MKHMETPPEEQKDPVICWWGCKRKSGANVYMCSVLNSQGETSLEPVPTRTSIPTILHKAAQTSTDNKSFLDKLFF